MPERDHVDEVIERWARERPEYDLSPVRIIGRMARIMEYVDSALEANFARFDINRATFDVLATLKRTGPPYALTQRELMSSLLRTSGSVSVRIDAMKAAGLVTREPAEDDRRAVRVVLTKAGHRLLEEVVPEHLRNEERLLAELDQTDRRALTALLRKLLISLEQQHEELGDLHFGIRVFTPRASLQRRRDLGLPDAEGVLVRDVLADSDADLSGLRKGDLITLIGGSPIASLGALRKALSGSARHTTMVIVRGSRRKSLRMARS